MANVECTDDTYQSPMGSKDVMFLNSDLLNTNILAQDLKYLGAEKIIELGHLFCRQAQSDYSVFYSLDATQQATLLHKLKGAAAGLGLVALYDRCQQLEELCKTSCENKVLSESQLSALDLLIVDSVEQLQNYIQELVG